MMNAISLSKTQTLKKRTARASGHSRIICVPVECIGRAYERSIDTVNGIINLIPTENTKFQIAPAEAGCPETIFYETAKECEECGRILTERDIREHHMQTVNTSVQDTGECIQNCITEEIHSETMSFRR